MALWEFSNQNKHKNWRTRIIYVEKGKSLVIPSGFGNTFSSRFKYIHTHPILPPCLTKNQKGEVCIIPGWKVVHPNTTLEDIKWEKPSTIKIERKVEKNEWLFESSSTPGDFYRVRQMGTKLTCDCSGFFRVKDREKGCKHVQQVRKDLATRK